MTSDSKNMGTCPDCGGEVRFKRSPYLGQLVTCRHCNVELEVISKMPIELDWAENGWDDDYLEEIPTNKSNRHRDNDDEW